MKNYTWCNVKFHLANLIQICKLLLAVIWPLILLELKWSYPDKQCPIFSVSNQQDTLSYSFKHGYVGVFGSNMVAVHDLHICCMVVGQWTWIGVKLAAVVTVTALSVLPLGAVASLSYEHSLKHILIRVSLLVVYTALGLIISLLAVLCFFTNVTALFCDGTELLFL